ncbi:MAG: endo-1,4-beta-xylanase [Rikenellaceae bacterium]
MQIVKLYCALIALTQIVACDTFSTPSSRDSLRVAYSDYFPIGVALGAHTYATHKADSLIRQHFNTITAENCMKPHHIGRHEGQYNFKQADEMIAYAWANGMSVRGHALVWYQSAPEWFFADAPDGSPVTRELVYERLRTYIHAVVSHFKGRVYCWDVVNEAISDKPGEYLREDDNWHKLCGGEFIEKAFIYAHEADPDALLFYNEYGITYPEKRNNTIQLIKDLQAKGVPIHGIGMQSHWNIEHPTRDALVETIEEFRKLNLIIHSTELDVRMDAHWAGGQLTAEDHEHAVYEYTPELEERQDEQYRMIFETFREYKEDIRSVTFWNLYDSQTWLDVRKGNLGRHYPLLFDDYMEPKKCYYSVVDF